MIARAALLATLGGALLATPSAAADEAWDDAYEINVYGDLFKRWKDSRWLVKTELLVPHAVWFRSAESGTFATNSFQVRVVLGCDQEATGQRRRLPASCTIEDIAIQSTAWADADVDIQPVLDEIDRRLTGARIRLQVTNDGQVVGHELERIDDARGHEGLQGTLSEVVARVVSAFDMQVRKGVDLTRGTWEEHNPPIMDMPGVQARNSASVVVHRLEIQDGSRTVETRGRGELDDGINLLRTTYTGVALYDHDQGYMVERVWALVGRPDITRTAWQAQLGMDYFFVGRLRLLGEGEVVDLGPTRRIAPYLNSIDGLPDWQPIDQ